MTIDWGAAWDVLNSNLVGLVIATIIGVALASYIQHRQAKEDMNSRKKRVALTLGYEIAQMKAIASASTEQNRRLIDAYKTEVGGGKRYFLAFNDMPMSRTIYDRPSTDLSLLPPETVAQITDLYRRLELCNHIRGLGDAAARQGNSLMPSIAGVTDSFRDSPQMAPTLKEIDKAINQFISYSEMYLANMNNLITLCQKALVGLSTIAPVNPALVAKVTMFSPDSPANTQGGTST